MSPTSEGLTRLVARRISEGIGHGESPREIASAILVMVGQRTAAEDPVVGAGASVIGDPPDLNTVAALAPVVAVIVDAAEQAILQRAVGELRNQAMLQFDEGGSGDVRGAALWDAASHLNPDDGDALKVGRGKEG